MPSTTCTPTHRSHAPTPTTPSASRPLSTVFTRASRRPRGRPPTRCSASRRPLPPGHAPGADAPVALRWKLRRSPAMMPRTFGNSREGSMAKGILVAAMDFSEAPEDEFHDWYDLEHIPERLRIPGFLNGERWLDAKNPRISVAT